MKEDIIKKNVRIAVDILGFTKGEIDLKVAMERCFAENPTRDTVKNMFILAEGNNKVVEYLNVFNLVASFAFDNNLKVTALQVIYRANELFAQKAFTAARRRYALEYKCFEREQ